MAHLRAIVISGDLAEQHARRLQALYDLNKQGLAVGGRYLEQVLDVIRSLRGMPTKQEIFAKAWEGYSEISGVLWEHYMAGLLPDGSSIDVPTSREI